MAFNYEEEAGKLVEMLEEGAEKLSNSPELWKRWRLDQISASLRRARTEGRASLIEKAFRDGLGVGMSLD